ncbi:MAG TPA: prepilin-type N-terminal cleavage/methylation domain-containing protein [Thiotrichaceae bacterium]|nr:prepilin-type N-terminal cleavage/methylation domain-containing protein [Thiotrichaceae bacterium]
MKHQHGFTLIELAVVLTIIALLIGSLLIPLTTQIDVAKIRSTEKTLDQVKEALIHYAVANNRLPCPATDVDTGLEVNTVMNCQMEGYFPWANLGMGRYDAWGNPFIYRVDQTYTQEIMTPNLTSLPDTFSNIEVRDIQNTAVVDSDVVAIIYSTGKNGEAYQPATQFPNFMGTNSHLWLPLKTISNLIIAPAFALGRGSDDIYYQDSLIPNKYDDVLIFLSKSHLVAVSQRVQTTTVAVVMPVLDDSVYTPVLPTAVASSDSEQTGNTGSTDSPSTTDTGSTDTGSTDNGSTDTGSTDTGSTDSGSTDTGSTDTGSTDTGSTDTGSTDSGSTDTGSTDSGSSDSGSTDGGMNRSGDGFNPDGDFGGLMGGGFLQQFDNQP